MTKKYKFFPLEDGDKISPSIAITSAVQLLDLAAEIAVDAKDVDKMLKVSDKWLDFGERLAEYPGVEDEDDEEESESEITKGFGFVRDEKSIMEVAEGDDDGPTDED